MTKHQEQLLRTCTKCGELKPLTDYYLRKNRGNAPHAECKVCYLIKSKRNWERSKDYRLGQQKVYYSENKDHAREVAKKRFYSPEEHKKFMFRSIKARVGKQKMYINRKLLFTKEEFLSFLPQTSYEEVFKIWEENGYARKFSPSVDRIDNNGDYSLDNIQILSLSDNVKKKHRVDYALLPDLKQTKGEESK